MIFRVIILFILCFSSTIFAQQLETQIETLEQELNQESKPKEQITILEKLWQLTQYKDDNAAVKYAKQAIQISEEADLKNELAKSYERLGIAYSNLSKNKLSNNAYLKAIKLHKSLDNKRRISGIYMNQAINFKDEAKYDSALVYIENSKPFIDEYCCKDDSILMINYNSIKSNIYLEQGKYLLSLENAIKAAELSISSRHKYVSTSEIFSYLKIPILFMSMRIDSVTARLNSPTRTSLALKRL